MVDFHHQEQASKPSLMTMSTEIQAKILRLASAGPDPILPQQFAPGSTKFSLSSDMAAPLGTGYCPALTRNDGALPRELSAFDIGRTCRTLHNIIDGDNLFYANNEFEFYDTQGLLDYLVALPSERRNSIRSIKVNYDYHQVPVAAFTILAVCYRLEHLTLDIRGMTNFFEPNVTDFSQAPGYAQLMALRGLKSVKLVYGNKSWTLIDNILARIPRAWVSPNKAETEQSILRTLQQLEHNINQATKQPRPGHPLISAGELNFAMNQARVNSWGDTINGTLAPPGHANTNLSTSYNNNMNPGANHAATPVAQPPVLSETEQWAEMDRTNLASWDV
jgi:hypothetical protein